MTSGYEKTCLLFAQFSEVFTIHVFDKMEYRLPKLGWVRLTDVESGKQRWVNTSSDKFSTNWYERQIKMVESYRNFLLKNDIKNISVSTDEDIVEKLSNLL